MNFLNSCYQSVKSGFQSAIDVISELTGSKNIENVYDNETDAKEKVEEKIINNRQR